MIDSILGLASSIIERVIPDPQQKLNAQIKLLELQQAGELQAMAGQLEANKIEAGSGDRFVSGWRPAVGWVCASGLAFQFVLGPILTWGAELANKQIQFPRLDMDVLLSLLLGMLGLGAYRTVEKLKGVAAK